MKKSDIAIWFGTPHRLREPGKNSPDGRLKEAVYGRELCKALCNRMQEMGYIVGIDYEALDLPKNMQSPSSRLERQRELGMRVNIVNELCRQRGAKRCIYVSTHVDASGIDGKWHDPHGWSVRVSPKASAQSRLLANCLFDAAKAQGLHMRQPLPSQKYWEQSLKVLNETACPAVLTENLFQDNKEDVDFLLGGEGRQAIILLHIDGITKYIESL